MDWHQQSHVKAKICSLIVSHLTSVESICFGKIRCGLHLSLDIKWQSHGRLPRYLCHGVSVPNVSYRVTMIGEY